MDQGGNDTKDSDGVPTYKANGRTLDYTWIGGILLHPAEELAYGFEQSKHHDSGFYFDGPSLSKTGSTGTTLVYAFGALLFLGAGAMLITRKRRGPLC